jgi:hypothetical protein
MNATTNSSAAPDSVPDPRQKQRLILGVVVWLAGWALAVAMIPLVNRSELATGLKATINGILLIGAPKVFLVIAVAIMGKPGFTYLKSLLGGYFRRLAPAATVSPLRYRMGLILLVTMILLSSIGDYVTSSVLQLRQQYPYLVPMAGDVLILASLFLLGGDFWDKLRALFSREAKVVFPGDVPVVEVGDNGRTTKRTTARVTQ